MQAKFEGGHFELEERRARKLSVSTEQNILNKIKVKNFEWKVSGRWEKGGSIEVQAQASFSAAASADLRKSVCGNNVVSSYATQRRRSSMSSWTYLRISRTWADLLVPPNLSWNLWSKRARRKKKRKYISQILVRSDTYVYEFVVVALLQIVQNGCFVKICEISHIFDFLEFGRVHLSNKLLFVGLLLLV